MLTKRKKYDIINISKGRERKMYRMDNKYNKEYQKLIGTLLQRAGFTVTQDGDTILINSPTYKDEELIEKMIDFNLI